MLMRLILKSPAQKCLLWGRSEGWRKSLDVSQYRHHVYRMGLDPVFPWMGFSSKGGEPFWGVEGSERRALAGWRLANDDIQMEYSINCSSAYESIRARDWMISLLSQPELTLQAFCYVMRGNPHDGMGDVVGIEYETPVTLSYVDPIAIGGPEAPAEEKRRHQTLRFTLERHTPLWNASQNMQFWFAHSDNGQITGSVEPTWVDSSPANGRLMNKHILRADGVNQNLRVPGTGPHNFAMYMQGPYSVVYTWSEMELFLHRPINGGLRSSETRIIDFGWKEIRDTAADMYRMEEALSPMSLSLLNNAAIAQSFGGSGSFTPAVLTGSEGSYRVNTGARVEVTPRTTSVLL